MKQNFSIAISPCPNDIYIFGGIILGQVITPEFELKFDFKDIQELNRLAIEGEKDIIKVSAAALPPLLSSYEVLPAGGALGMGVGPLLLTHNCEVDSSRNILIPGENTTANFLLNRFLGNPQNKTFVAFDELYQTLCKTPGTQGVVIHENRFTYQEDGLSLGVDLGQRWQKETGLPLPLGVIISRTQLEIKKGMTHLIQESITWAKKNPQVILDLCRNYSQSMRDDVLQSHIDIYVNGFSYDMGGEGKRALESLLEFSSL